VIQLRLKHPRISFRLRCGDYRVFVDNKDETSIRFAVKNRREAYR
jgi:mRNA-degrading endonuclease RelE of RelBE toxin-antitoxin system